LDKGSQIPSGAACRLFDRGVELAALGAGLPFSPGFFAGRRGKPLIVNGFATLHREIIA
jgi:hypothetical protein